MKNLLLILLATLFVACNEGTRYDEPDMPVTTNNTPTNVILSNYRPSLDTVKVDSVEEVLYYSKTYKVSKYGYTVEEAVALNKGIGFYFIDVPITDILSRPDFAEVREVTVYQSKYYRPSLDGCSKYGAHKPETLESYKIQEDSTLRADLSSLRTGQWNFDVIVVYGIKVKVPITQSLTYQR